MSACESYVCNRLNCESEKQMMVEELYEFGDVCQQNICLFLYSVIKIWEQISLELLTRWI